MIQSASEMHMAPNTRWDSLSPTGRGIHRARCAVLPYRESNRPRTALMKRRAMAGLIDLEPLFRPRSVAVVGASPRPSVGRNIIDTLKAFGFAGDIYPVNPGYEAIDDVPCFASLA